MAEEIKKEELPGEEKQLKDNDAENVNGGTPMGISFCKYCGHALVPTTFKCAKCGRKN